MIARSLIWRADHACVQWLDANHSQLQLQLGAKKFMLSLLFFSIRTVVLVVLVVIILLLGGCGAAYYQFGRDLPSHREVVDYEPNTITRVYASDGALMAEYAEERRLFVPIEAVPQHVQDAFLAAEDKDFYTQNFYFIEK